MQSILDAINEWIKEILIGAMQEVQKEQAAKEGKPYYDNDLVVAKPDGAPINASWVSSQFGKLLEDLEMLHVLTRTTRRKSPLRPLSRAKNSTRPL